jgi:hypothetical protein
MCFREFYRVKTARVPKSHQPFRFYDLIQGTQEENR